MSGNSSEDTEGNYSNDSGNIITILTVLSGMFISSIDFFIYKYRENSKQKGKYGNNSGSITIIVVVIIDLSICIFYFTFKNETCNQNGVIGFLIPSIIFFMFKCSEILKAKGKYEHYSGSIMIIAIVITLLSICIIFLTFKYNETCNQNGKYEYYSGSITIVIIVITLLSICIIFLTFKYIETCSKNEQLERRCEQLERRCGELQSDKEQLERRCGELQSDKEQLERRCGELQSDKEQLERCCEELQHEIDRRKVQYKSDWRKAELYADWRKEEFQTVPVNLDADTAHPALSLSQQNRCITWQEEDQDVPDNPQRFSSLPCVLGQLGITSGRCFWEVDIANTFSCDLGICRDNVKRKGRVTMSPQNGFWAIRVYNKEYWALTSPETPLTLREHPRRVGIFLDYEAGDVSFYNMTDGSHIFSFSRISFQGVLKPLFRLWSSDSGSLTIV